MTEPAPIREGDPVPPIELAPGLDQVVRYCALGWTFVTFFYDADEARRLGLPGAIVPGPLKLGLLYRAVEQLAGKRGRIVHVRAAHRRPNLVGAPMTIAGSVAAVYEADGEQRADIELVITNDEGEPTVQGLATIEFAAPEPVRT